MNGWGPGLAIVAALSLSAAPAAAAPAPITGKLDRSGYTVMALAATGQAATVLPAAGDFSLVPPAPSVTLQLRAPDGTYAGPVVVAQDPSKVARARREVSRATKLLRRAQRLVAGRGASPDARKRIAKARTRVQRARKLLTVALRERARQRTTAIVGVRAGARLGHIEIKSGYAVARGLATRKGSRWVDATRTAQASFGIPIGAGNFGRVRSARTDGASIGDLDRDGVPQPLDIDDDGDLILDNIDLSLAGSAARAAQETGCGPDNIYCPDVYSGLVLFLQQTVNANAGSTTEQIDTALATHGHIVFAVGQTGSRTELDCAGDLTASPPRPGLRYCSAGGSGEASVDSIGAPPFPGDPGSTFDPDRDGFGLLDPMLQPLACGGGCPSQFFLNHGAVARRAGLDLAIPQIGSGDAFVEHIAADGDTSRCPPPAGEVLASCSARALTVPYVFATVPALVAYSDTAGGSATVTYPPPPFDPNCGPSCNARGTGGAGFPVSPGPDGNVRLALTLWRPQRRAIPGSDPPGAEWMDVGHLTYGVILGAGGPTCGTDTLSEDDPDLIPTTVASSVNGRMAGLVDQRDDAPSSPGDASPERTLSFTLNLTQCLAGNGQTFSDERILQFIAAPSGRAFATQNVAFRPPSGVTVRNVTDPAEAPTTGTEFEFRPLGRPNFKLRHDGAQVFPDIPPGEFQVEELDAPGYQLAGITCDDSDSTGSTTDRRATFKIGPGEHVTCTFRNAKN